MKHNKREQHSWIPHSRVNFGDETIKQYHVDTRDFHVLCNTKERDKPLDLSTIVKYGNRFIFTAEEVSQLIERYYNESGGERQWRFFFLKGNDGWALKYIRIVRTEHGLVVCDSSSHALNRETLNGAVGKNEYSY